MSRTGFIDHIGIGVPDLAAARGYYDELMPVLGLRAWFATTEAGEFNYGPDGARGWAVAHDAEVVHEPREFPEYGEHYATYFLDPHGFMLEVVCHSADEA
jgi:catechol 2,3-dioxygenase-like lactoylglutathione lyase family enzyme